MSSSKLYHEKLSSLDFIFYWSVLWAIKQLVCQEFPLVSLIRFVWFAFETVSCRLCEDGFELMILLPYLPRPEITGLQHPMPFYMVLGIKPRATCVLDKHYQPSLMPSPWLVSINSPVARVSLESKTVLL